MPLVRHRLGCGPLLCKQRNERDTKDVRLKNGPDMSYSHSDASGTRNQDGKLSLKRMTIWAMLVALVAAILTPAVTAQAAPAPQPATASAAVFSTEKKNDSVEGKTFTIATDTTFAPFVFREPGTGEMTGIDMELLYAIAEDQGFKVNLKSLGFQAAVSSLTSGQADGVIAGMGVTDERKKIFDFSDAYYESGSVMAIDEKNDDVKGYEDLQGKTVVAKGGSEGERAAKKLAKEYGFKIKPLDQSAAMVQSVKNGSAVGVFDDDPVLRYGITQGSGLKIVTPKIPGGDYAFAVKKGQNQDLLKAFNRGLANLKSSGEYQKIMNKYLDPQEAESAGDIFGLLKQSWPALQKGLINTLIITGVSFVIAMVLGLIFGFMRISNSIVLRGIARAYVAIFRGTPLLVWAFLFYFGVPQLFNVKGDIFMAGVATLSLNAGAYLTEIVRGGLQAVDPGQMEAARSLGMGWGKSMRRVVVPQAVKISTPSIINQFVITLKDSSLLLTIGFAELLYQAQQIYAANYRVTETLIIVGIMYFVVITILTWIADLVDKKVNK